jgi:eukaryotic-like serine/threonine-protein kinase
MCPNLPQEPVREQLARIVESGGFKANPRASAFLSHVVERTLLGRAGEIKEATIGVEVFGRLPGYDTKSDPVVRSVARVLREKLNDYYLAHPGEEVRIELPKGTYVPVFRLPSLVRQEQAEPTQPPLQPVRWRSLIIAGGLMAALAVVGVLVANRRPDLAHPAPPRVYRGDAGDLYRQGREKFLAGDYPGARPILEQAAALDPDRAPIHATLADDLRFLGYDSLALTEARKAEGETAGLSPAEALQVEASFRAAAGDFKGAFETLSRLQHLEPNRPEHLRELARLQMSAADYPACLRTIAVAGGAAGDAQLSLIEAFCRAGTGGYQAALQPARRAAALAKRSGILEIYARARLLESGLLMSTGHVEESRPARDEARQICAAIGDRPCVLRSLRVQANLDLATAGPGVALGEYRKALPLAKELGSAGEMVNLLRGEGVSLTNLGDFASANAALVEALLTAQTAGQAVSTLRLNLADLAIEEGQLSRAGDLAAEAAEGARRAGDKDTETQAQVIRAKALLLAGDLKGSQRCLDESPMKDRGVKLPTATVALCLLSRANLNRVTGRIDSARRQLEEAQSIGEPLLASELATEQIELLLDQGDYGAAQRRAEQVLAAVARMGKVSEAARIAALLSDAYGGSGQREAAWEALASARAMLSDRSAPLARIKVLISAGRWNGNSAEADRSLGEAIELARRTGFRLAEGEARQVLLRRERRP